MTLSPRRAPWRSEAKKPAAPTPPPAPPPSPPPKRDGIKDLRAAAQRRKAQEAAP